MHWNTGVRILPVIRLKYWFVMTSTTRMKKSIIKTPCLSISLLRTQSVISGLKLFPGIRFILPTDISKNRIDYNSTEFSVKDKNGYSYNVAIMASKEPSFATGTLNPNSFIRGWITYETLKNSTDFTLHFQKDDLTGSFYTDIILKK